MEPNVGKYDMIVRLALGVTLLVAAWLGNVSQLWLKIVLTVIAIILLYTALTRKCPILKMVNKSPENPEQPI